MSLPPAPGRSRANPRLGTTSQSSGGAPTSKKRRAGKLSVAELADAACALVSAKLGGGEGNVDEVGDGGLAPLPTAREELQRAVRGVVGDYAVDALQLGDVVGVRNTHWAEILCAEASQTLFSDGNAEFLDTVDVRDL